MTDYDENKWQDSESDKETDRIDAGSQAEFPEQKNDDHLSKFDADISESADEVSPVKNSFSQPFDDPNLFKKNETSTPLDVTTQRNADNAPARFQSTGGAGQPDIPAVDGATNYEAVQSPEIPMSAPASAGPISAPYQSAPTGVYNSGHQTEDISSTYPASGHTVVGANVQSRADVPQFSAPYAHNPEGPDRQRGAYGQYPVAYRSNQGPYGQSQGTYGQSQGTYGQNSGIPERNPVRNESSQSGPSQLSGKKPRKPGLGTLLACIITGLIVMLVTIPATLYVSGFWSRPRLHPIDILDQFDLPPEAIDEDYFEDKLESDME